jgi:hypothetical protein
MRMGGPMRGVGPGRRWICDDARTGKDQDEVTRKIYSLESQSISMSAYHGLSERPIERMSGLY